MLAGDDQDVEWRLGADVFEGQHLVVLIDKRCRDLVFRDLAEQAVVGHGTSVVRLTRRPKCNSRSPDHGGTWNPLQVVTNVGHAQRASSFDERPKVFGLAGPQFQQ